ncbi:hypothetical protein CLF_109156 [Clonorchis sinensis]|nr:hypothetical protein CLF_109156 [Clonorchis sinensis]
MRGPRVKKDGWHRMLSAAVLQKGRFVTTALDLMRRSLDRWPVSRTVTVWGRLEEVLKKRLASKFKLKSKTIDEAFSALDCWAYGQGKKGKSGDVEEEESAISISGSRNLTVTGYIETVGLISAAVGVESGVKDQWGKGLVLTHKKERVLRRK